MDLLFPDDGLVEMLTRIANPGLKYRLFVNNLIPTLSTTLAGITEAAWAGYNPFTLTWADYTLHGVSSHTGYGISPPILFANASGAGVQAYGYYVTNNANSILMAIARFDGAPITIPDGGTYSVFPVLGDLSQLTS
jgi:hypothetical protein